MYQQMSNGPPPMLSQTSDTSAPVGSRLLNYMQRPPPPPSDNQIKTFQPMQQNQMTPPRVMTSMNSTGYPIEQASPSQMPQTPVQAAGSMYNSNKMVSASPVSAPEFVPTQQMAQMQMFQDPMGGTTYFYNNNEQASGSMSHDSHSAAEQFVTTAGDGNVQLVLPNFYLYPAPPPHLARLRPKGAALNTYFAPTEVKMDLLTRQLVTLAQPDPNTLTTELPPQIEQYRNLCPLEMRTGGDRPGFFMGHTSSVYKVVNTKDGLQYCLRRLHNCRLTNSKCLSMVDMWKKLVHSNVVQLRDVFTTKAFGDVSLVFVYDYHATAETVRARHFGADGNLSPHKSNGLYDEIDRARKVANGPKFPSTSQSGGIAESVVWSYVIQLSSALRAIHTAGLAARTMDPTKILVMGKSKLIINGAGIMDCLTYEGTHNNMAHAIQMYQADDLYGLGRLIVALGCGSLQSATRDNLQPSIQMIAHNYSTDLKNIVTYLLTPVQQGRCKAINDIMPMIGARFFTHLESLQMRADLLENELSKEIENGRLFRLACKLNTITERPNFGPTSAWSETGDRYLLKLFRNYVFHSVTPDGSAWIDMAHIIHTLNKLDAGVHEQVQ